MLFNSFAVRLKVSLFFVSAFLIQCCTTFIFFYMKHVSGFEAFQLVVKVCTCFHFYIYKIMISFILQMLCINHVKYYPLFLWQLCCSPSVVTEKYSK